MSKKLTCLSVIAAIALLFSPLQSFAQGNALNKRADAKAMGPVKVDKQQAAKYKLLSERLQFPKVKQNSPFKSAMKAPVRRNAVRRSAGVLTAGEKVFWGDWEYDPLNPNLDLGWYQVDPGFMNPVQLMSFMNLDGGLNYGAAVVDGVLYGCTYYLFWGLFGMFDRVAIDTNTWEVISLDYGDMPDAAIDTATDPTTGLVYGVFFNEAGDGYVLATMDYPTWTRSDIAPLENNFVAIGITSKGVMYGVDALADLYIIDKATAAVTLVGPTGLNFVDATGSYYGMSGDIDPSDDTFFMNAIDASNLNTGLYFIDLETGAATQQGYDTGQIFNLMTPPAAIEGGVPAKPENVTLEVDGSTANAIVKFTVPTTTYDGGELTGEVSYEVTQNGQVLAEGTAQPGDEVVANVVANAEGQQFFTVVLSNAAGKSPLATIGAWIGLDIPSAVTDLEFNLEENVATVSWNAPEAGIHGGYQGDLCYNVYRIVNDDKVKVAEAITETTFTEELEIGSLSVYKYAVEALNANYTGALVYSDGVIEGDAFQVPYSALMTEEGFNFFTTFDGNGDGRTWSYMNNQFYMTYSYDGDNDDWLITPPIYLEAGKSYAFNVNAQKNSEYYFERFEVKMGNAANPEAMTTTIVEPTDLSFTPEDYGSEVIRVEESGNYYFGIHSISDYDQFNTLVNSITVDFGLEPVSPKAVENLTVTPDAKGALKAEVKFTAPTLNIGEEAIEGDVIAKIYRDDEVIAEQTVAPGAEVSYLDEEVPYGAHVYQVVPFVGENRGVKSEKVSVFVGMDVPDAVTVTETLNPAPNRVHLAWTEANKGVNGGIVLPEETYYLVYDLPLDEQGYLMMGEMVDSLFAETSTDFAAATETGEGTLGYWGVMPGNQQAGAGSLSIGSMFIGQPMTLPFFEDYAGQTLAANSLVYFRSSNLDDYTGGLQWAKESSDGDGSCLNFVSTVPESWINMSYGKLNAANGALNPVILFDYKLDNAANNAQVIIDNQKGKRDVIDLPNKGEGWQLGKVDLKEYASEDYIVPYLGVNFVEAGNMLIDNIMMIDQLEYNLVASIEAPEKVEAGQNAKVNVTVLNLGVNAANNYVVRVFADDEELALDGAKFDEIAPLASRSFTANFREDIFTDAKDVKLKVVVEYDLDLDPDDNVDETVISVKTASLAGPENVTASVKDNGVHVAWSVPEVSITEKTEDFEDTDVFVPFSTGGIDATNHYGNLGDWSLYDGNGILVYSFQNYSYPNDRGPLAWQVMNAPMVDPEFAENMGAASGDQYLQSRCTGYEEITETDHWLISPQLPGSEQTISFNVRVITDQYGVETYEVLASSNGISPSDFTVVQSFSADNTEWSNVEVTLPAGTKYFAIRHTSNDIFGLMIDDAKFVTMGGANLKGYKVYVDRILVAGLAEDVTGYVYEQFLTNGAHEIGVSGVMDNGLETKPVTVVVNVNNAPTAIESIIAKGEPFDVFTVDGVAVRRNVTNVAGLKAGVYVVNGQKVVIK